MRLINKIVRPLSLILALSFLLTGCGKNTSKEPQVDTIDDNYRVFYEIFVGSFSDSDGDGTGDIRGIINRLDYLNDGDINSGESLGVQGIWLSPIFKSPSYHGYDVTNYYEIDERYGTEDDLKELLTLCHERNIKVILDLPINHTSTSNVWFMKFTSAHVSGLTDNEYYDYYSWAPLSDRISGLAYTKIPGSTTNEFYECNFSSDMPELNFDNEAVRQQCVDIAKYWLDFGVDGFRFDAAKYIYYNDKNASIEFWDWYMSELRKIKEDVYTVGEVWSADSETLEYVTALNCFNFQFGGAEGILSSGVTTHIEKYTSYIENYQSQVLAANSEYGMMMNFISNHDMDRAAGYLTLATKRAYMAANLLLLTPGSPFIYYGEEIGMKGTRGSSNTDANRRLKMNWGDGDTVKNPTGADYADSKQTNGTVAEQLADENSLCNHYARVIAFRNTYPEIARGIYKALDIDTDFLGGFEITYDGSVSYLLHNVGDEDITVNLADILPAGSDYTLSGSVGLGDAKLSNGVLTIGSRTSCIIK